MNIGLKLQIDSRPSKETVLAEMSNKVPDAHRSLMIAQLESVINDSMAAVILIDDRQRIMVWGRGASRIYGYSAEEALDSDASLLTGASRKEEIEAILKRLREGQRVVEWETTHVRKNGMPVMVSLSILPRRDAKGNLIGACMVESDVTEQRRARERLEQSNADLEQFAFLASHDLQEPLRKISSYAELLAAHSGGNLIPAAREDIAVITKGASRMKGLINGLLEYSRTASRNLELRPTRLSEVATEAIETLSLAIQESGAIVTMERLPVVLCHRELMTQVFFNLIANAIKFRSDRKPNVHISAQHMDTEWEISVQDNGVGVDPTHSGLLFQPFRRLHPGYPGAGMGLAICRKVVERHGGRIWMESQPGKGSIFRFTIPSPARALQ